MKKTTLLRLTQIALCAGSLYFFQSCRPAVDPTPEPLVVSCDKITSPVVWEDRGEGVDYIVECLLDADANITIKPGVKIHFKQHAGINFAETAALIAVGTSDKPIELLGSTGLAGEWRGIYLDNNVQNEMSYVTISGGGSKSFNGHDVLSNIRIVNDGKLKMSNCTITKSGRDGIYSDGLSGENNRIFSVYQNNSITNNTGYPISCSSSIITDLDGTGSSYQGNGNNSILIRNGGMIGNHSWKKMANPYYIEGLVEIGSSSQAGGLTLEPGVNINFGSGAGITTYEYNANCYLNVAGTASEKVVLTSSLAAPGAWRGLCFQSKHVSNRISHAVIRFGGHSAYTGASQIKGNVVVGGYSGGKVAIDNTIIGNSAAYGIVVTSTSDPVDYSNNVTFEGNTLDNYHEF